MNVKKTLVKLRKEPLSELLGELSYKGGPVILQDEFTLYAESHFAYYLAIERLLPTMSLAHRFDNGIAYKMRDKENLTKRERGFIKKYFTSRRFLELDFFTFIIFARILLDRTIALGQFFISGSKHQPSFRSFNDHKKFFLRTENIPYGMHEKYARYIRKETNWFSEVLKFVRDKHIIHANTGGMRFFGYPGLSSNDSLEMVLILPETPGSLAKVRHRVISPLKIIRDIEAFLLFFNQYGCEVLSQKTGRHSK